MGFYFCPILFFVRMHIDFLFAFGSFGHNNLLFCGDIYKSPLYNNNFSQFKRKIFKYDEQKIYHINQYLIINR